MEVHAIETLLQGLQPFEYGWQGYLPAQSGSFFGRSIGIEFETRTLSNKDPPPEINATETALAQLILSDLETVLRRAEERISEHLDGEGSGLLDDLQLPHIWMSREVLEEEGSTRWSFIVGRQDAPEMGFHLEFVGADCKDVWAVD